MVLQMAWWEGLDLCMQLLPGVLLDQALQGQGMCCGLQCAAGGVPTEARLG